MPDALWWFIAVEALGLAAFPAAFYLLPGLRDRGYAFSKPLGLLFIGYALWILSQFHILPNARLTVIALLLLMALGSATYLVLRRREFLAFVSRERYAILAAEGLFLVFYIGWVLYRAYDPSIESTEKPMDFAFLNASLQARFAPPEDPWLRGEAISYYYFGYWVMAAVSKLTAVPSSTSYNLALALIPAMGATAIFGLVYNMIRSESNALRPALLAGAMGAVILLVVGNLEGILEFMRANGMGSLGFWDWVGIKGLDGPNESQSWRPDEFWWWWRATRVIDTLDGIRSLDYTIQEFPFFSFLLGDLHPHVMAIPFILLFLAFCLNLLSMPSEVGMGWLLRRPQHILVLGLSLGALGFINVWDIATFAALLVAVALVRTYAVRGGSLKGLFLGTFPLSALVIALAVTLYIPFYTGLSSQASGILPVDEPTTRPVHFLLIWGLFLVVVVPFLLGVFIQTRTGKEWARLAFFSLAVALAPFLAWAFLHLELGGRSGDLTGRFFHILPLGLLVAVAVYTALMQARDGASPGKVFALVLAALGFLLLLGPELLYVVDFFGTRMNTVFKLYYQAWILLAVAAAFGLYYLRNFGGSGRYWVRLMGSGWFGLFLILFVASLYYPAASVDSKAGGFQGQATLDGLAFVARSQPAEYEAINWLRWKAEPGAGILEAVGGEYSAFGRVSASTGIPTVLGWAGHELQWRGSSLPFAGREGDVATIYQTDDPLEARQLLDKYDIQYVYVGPRERQKYGEQGLEKLSTFMDRVFDGDGVTIYRLRE